MTADELRWLIDELDIVEGTLDYCLSSCDDDGLRLAYKQLSRTIGLLNQKWLDSLSAERMADTEPSMKAGEPCTK